MSHSSANPPPPPPPNPRGPGLRSFGGYEIEGELGRGGMGVVYLARQIKLNRHVALKMLTGHYGPDELQRFLAEAETAAGLHHTNIAHIYEVGEHDGAPFFSMEYVQSGSLADRLRKQPFSFRETAQFLISVARALHFAHQNGVVHRDMKPGNVLLDPEGVPKVADFGIAKRLTQDSKLTVSGAIMGTPTYMAPEQAKGTSRDVGAAADVYSLGAILYEMLTGRPPFLPEDSETAITVRVLTEDPVSPAWHRPDVPRDLETICMKCLEKEPRDRYASAAAFAEDLRRYLDDEAILAKPPTTAVRTIKWIRRHPWKFVTQSVLFLITGAALLRLAQWELYERPRFEYASTVDTLDGRMEPDTRLTAAEASRRQVSYRMTRRGRRGLVTRVEALNSRGHPAAVLQFFHYDVLPNWIDGIAGMQKFDDRRRETTAIEFTFRDGAPAEETGLDCNGRPIWRISFDRAVAIAARAVRARFFGGSGFDLGGRQGAASLAELGRDTAGRDVRARFFDSSGQPAQNGEGVYGYDLTRNGDGRIVRLVNIGRDGRPTANRSAVFGLELTWNERGQVTRSAYLDVAGNPVIYHGIVASEYTYDAAGNVVQTRFVNAEGRLANFGDDGPAQVDFKRNERGEATEQINHQLNFEGQLAISSRRLFAYDNFGYPSDIQLTGRTTMRAQFRFDSVGNVLEDRSLDAAGQPVLGSKGWAIRRVSHSDVANPLGWREEETYFDPADKKMFSTSGHHRQISEFDLNGNLRRITFEDNDPARFKYYRYLAEVEYDTRARLRRRLIRYEDEQGMLASQAGLPFTSTETQYDENERETLEWKLGCDVEALGAPVLRTDTQWHATGARKRRVREACDANRKTLAFISNGTAARFEEEFNEIDRLERIYETGFDEKLVGFSVREAKFAAGDLQSVRHTRGNGTTLDTVSVFIRSVDPQQPKAAELHAGDQLLAANDKPVTSAYGWVFSNFSGGWIEVLRHGRRVRIEGFEPGALGVVLEDRAPTTKQ